MYVVVPVLCFFFGKTRGEVHYTQQAQDQDHCLRQGDQRSPDGDQRSPDGDRQVLQEARPFGAQEARPCGAEEAQEARPLLDTQNKKAV